MQFTSKIETKGCTITKLTETGALFKPWSGRMRDFLVKQNPAWGPLLDQAASREHPIHKASLANSSTQGICHTQVAESLYTFISEFISDGLYEGRERAAELGNGFELWRRYHEDFRGGDKEVRESAQHEFLTFGRVDHIKHLSNHLDKWEDLRRRWCMDFPDTQTFTLLKNIIPVDMMLEVSTVSTVTTTTALMQWLRLRTNVLKRYETQEALRKARSKSTHAAPLTLPTNQVAEESAHVRTAPFNTAAKSGGGGNRNSSPGRGASPGRGGGERQRSASPGGRRTTLPDPKYGNKDGKRQCWFCDSTEHTRHECEKYKAARKANGGKHVAGKYEDWKARQAPKSRIAPLQEQDLQLTEDEDECPPCPVITQPLKSCVKGTAPKVNMWALPCRQELDAQCMPKVEPAPEMSTSNSSEALFSELIDEEEKELAATLGTWAKVKPSKNSTKRRVKKDAKERQEWLLAVEEKRKIIAAELENLADDEELVLVDSGCGNHACHPKKHFKGFDVRPSAGSRTGQVFVTANEAQLPNVGEKVVRFRTMEGEQCQIVVQCTDVAMPIFSTRELGKTHRTVFADEHEDQGYFEHRRSGSRTKFYSKDGVYFVRIKLTPEVPEVVPDKGFVRPA